MKGERVAQLELILRSHPEGLRKSEIARRLGVHRSTIGRYVEELKQHNNIYEDKNLIKIVQSEEDEPMALSVYESLALNMGAELLLSDSELRTPHLASGLRKIAMGMKGYAPKVSANIIAMAEDIEKESTTSDQHSSQVLEVLIDAWISGKIVKIIHFNVIVDIDEETELAPYFIGFVETDKGRNPVTVTGRLRHTTEIITLDIKKIKSVSILNETYTIPDNLKAFRKMENPVAPEIVIDTIPLQLKVKEKSALNSFDTLSHGTINTTRQSDGSFICEFDAENSIELALRIIQSGDAVEVIGPASYRAKFIGYLKQILSIYE